MTPKEHHNLNGTEYYYHRNAQMDIMGILDQTGTEVVNYTYDSWGKIISIDGSRPDTVGEKNPYRYRGYRYDQETGLYYLQSRYYKPQWGRFLNADDLSILELTQGELFSHNLFMYCQNNPVMFVDPSGYWLLNAACFIAGAALFGGVTYFVGKIFGISGKTLTIAVASLGVLGGTLAAVLGPKFLSKAAPELVKWFKQVERNTKIFGPNKSGNIAGVVLFNAIKVMIHRSHIGKHNYYHIQIEVRTGGKWIVIGRVPITGKR